MLLYGSSFILGSSARWKGTQNPISAAQACIVGMDGVARGSSYLAVLWIFLYVMRILRLAAVGRKYA